MTDYVSRLKQFIRQEYGEDKNLMFSAPYQHLTRMTKSKNGLGRILMNLGGVLKRKFLKRFHKDTNNMENPS